MSTKDAELNSMFMVLCRSFLGDYERLVAFLVATGNCHAQDACDMLTVATEKTALPDTPTDEEVILIGHAMGNACQAMMVPFEFDENPVGDVTARGEYDVLVKKANALITMMSDVSAAMKQVTVK